MINRRIIRVKVMQALYAIANSDQTLQDQKASTFQSLGQKFDYSFNLFVYTLSHLVGVAQYATIDAQNKANKYLPTKSDLAVPTKISENEWLLKIISNAGFQSRVAEIAKQDWYQDEWIKKLYNDFVLTPEYHEYNKESFRHPAQEKEIIEQLWSFMQSHEKYNEHLNEDIAGWEDDKVQTYQLMENVIISPKKVNFLIPISAEKKEYAMNLAKTVIDKEDYLLELIQPKLQNWDAERVAMIDLVLIKMGLSELLYFPTIPTKVTINEYIDIAKTYSTPQSGQFVNGVLDNLLKELTQQDKISKQSHSKK